MEIDNVKTAIFGAGSMGTVLGAFLSKAGIAVDLISRDAVHINELKTKGAVITGTVSFNTAPFDGLDGRGLAMTPTEMRKKYDIIFLLTKQIDNDETAKFLQNYIEPNGIVCTMQNGLPEPALAEILGEEKVLGCICTWGAEKKGPGKVTLTTKAGNLTFGLGCLGFKNPGLKNPKFKNPGIYISELSRPELDRTSNNAHSMLPVVKSILENMGSVNIEENFIGARWSKLIINAAFSGLSAVSGYNFGKIASNKLSAKLALAVFKECIRVCEAANMKIEPVQGKDMARLFDYKNTLQKEFALFLLPFAVSKHRAIKSGMLHDLDQGKHCEIEHINGIVSKWGRKYNILTPINDKIINIIHSIERGKQVYSPENLKIM